VLELALEHQQKVAFREKVATFLRTWRSSVCANLWGIQMDDELPPRAAVNRAWTIYLSSHADVDPADHRRCALERYLHSKWQAGESDPEELTCSGLSYLSRIRPDSWWKSTIVNRKRFPDWLAIIFIVVPMAAMVVLAMLVVG
jgi:hypothetical protein